MSSDFEDVLYLFSCGALGKEPEITHSINIQEIYNISCKQGIWEIVFLSIKYLYKNNMIVIKKDVFKMWERTFLATAITQLKKLDIIHTVFCELKKNNIKAYLLKGDIISQYYKEPLSRISGDIDIYVGRIMIEKAEKVFEKCGFTVYARSPMEHHTVCKHAICGSVDLHLTFHDDCFEEKYFKGYTEITEQGIEYKIGDYKFTSLGATDNAIFLFLHWVKHFLSCGTGIRQIMDFFIFWKNNSQQINHSRFKQMLFDLGFSKLYATSVYIGLNYLQFNKMDIETFDFDTDVLFADWLLTDIEQGGVFGNVEHRRKTFYYLFYKNKLKINKKYFKMYANTFRYKYLSRKYIYLKKHKYLLPVAYLNRMYDLFLSALRVIRIMKNTATANDEYDRIKIIDSVCNK